MYKNDRIVVIVNLTTFLFNMLEEVQVLMVTS